MPRLPKPKDKEKRIQTTSLLMPTSSGVTQVTNSGAVTATHSTAIPVVSIGTDAISTIHIANGQFELIKAKQDIPDEKQLFSAKNNCIRRKTIVSDEKQLYPAKNNCF
ncbi:MAG: hypothetical protein LBG45_10325 [Dysgonamonadaceae bacterium]|nr:hypothetical protein [Dysgonamonadaceae bacterium]